jgi:aminopeptidase N
VTTADFVALAEKIGGKQLDGFFDTWLYRAGKPTTW